MEDFFHILKDIPLFNKIEKSDYEKLLHCMDYKIIDYKKDELIFTLDQNITHIGIILSGKVQITKEDIRGNRLIISNFSTSQLFGEAFTLADIKKSPVFVTAIEPSKILFVNLTKMLKTCTITCNFHNQLIQNMIFTLANKNLMLNQKIEILSKRSIREKLTTYFSFIISQTQNNEFTIPFNRNELADYLCVDRSAMSRELSKMRDDKELKYIGNKFTVLINNK